MVREVVAQPQRKRAPSTSRARRRQARTEEIVQTALKLCAEDGLDALTLARLARELDYAVGALYRYFDSKDALIAAMQQHVIEELAGRMDAVERAVDGLADERRADRPDRALAQVVGLATLYMRFPTLNPTGYRLIGLTLGDPRPLLSVEDGQRVMVAVGPVLAKVAASLDRAEGARALRPAPAAERALMLWSGLHGGMLLTKLERFAPTQLSTGRIVGGLLESLLLGWGADKNTFDRATELVSGVKMESLTWGGSSAEEK